MAVACGSQSKGVLAVKMWVWCAIQAAGYLLPIKEPEATIQNWINPEEPAGVGASNVQPVAVAAPCGRTALLRGYEVREQRNEPGGAVGPEPWEHLRSGGKVSVPWKCWCQSAFTPRPVCSWSLCCGGKWSSTPGVTSHALRGYLAG